MRPQFVRKSREAHFERLASLAATTAECTVLLIAWQREFLSLQPSGQFGYNSLVQLLQLWGQGEVRLFLAALQAGAQRKVATTSSQTVSEARLFVAAAHLFLVAAQAVGQRKVTKTLLQPLAVSGARLSHLFLAAAYAGAKKKVTAILPQALVVSVVLEGLSCAGVGRGQAQCTTWFQLLRSIP